jgi:hypothetical protein
MVMRAHRRRLVALPILLVFAAALPALAQLQGPTQNILAPQPYPYGYGHMMWGGPGGWGWYHGIGGPIFALLALIGIIAIFVWLVRWAVHGFPFHCQGFHHFLYGRSTAVDSGTVEHSRRILVALAPARRLGRPDRRQASRQGFTAGAPVTAKTAR